ncbi:MAG: SMI1/KNR4 family protein [Prevotella sp.]|nr:SMI1/KNR4 family protein [Prevotella sp.]
MTVEELIKRIQTFKEEYVSYFKPLEDADIHLYKNQLPFRLPEDYLSFLKFSNGIIISGDELFGISNKQFDIIKAYDIEHNEVKYPMPKFIVPFAPDGGGSYYCFDTSDNNKIVFWTSNYKYSDTDRPEIVNQDFCEWFNEVMLDWSIDIIGDSIFKP